MKKIILGIVLTALLCTACSGKTVSDSNTSNTNTNKSSEIVTNDKQENTTSVSSESENKTTETPTKSENNKTTSVNALKEYKKYLGTLDSKKMDSISKALNRAKSHLGSDLKANDDMCRAFMTFYYASMDAINENRVESESEDTFSESLLKKNGLSSYQSESGIFVGEKPEFLKKNFEGQISDGLRDYFILLDNEAKQVGEEGGYMFDDLAIMISWNDLADRIIASENYVKKYPSYPETKLVSEDIEFYLEIYLSSNLSNTPLYGYDHEKKILIFEQSVKESYERFLKKYAKSNYAPLIQGYLNKFDGNNAILIEEAIQYLKANKVDPEWLTDLVNQ